MNPTITLETLRFWVFVASIIVVFLVFVFYKSKEAKFKRLLRRELREFLHFEEISDWEFQGGEVSSFSNSSSTLLLEFHQEMTSPKLGRYLKDSLEGCGFVVTPPVRRNGGVHTMTATKGKNGFNMVILQGIHIDRSFHLSFEAAPALVPVPIND